MADPVNRDSGRLTAREYHRIGVEALEDHRLEDAVVALRQAVNENPHMGRTWNDLGVVMEALGNPWEAVRCYRQALAVQPGNPDAHANLSMLMLQMNMIHTLHRHAMSAGASY
ncbi:hypothetical protein [uncultured Paludibaculum sp.]|uniref:hypothetical protein n=1 Tax=uncultured Paludibaculum sp. TaxID=1765020 RepID=UPI002AABF3D3|nr:hypothetical protein [uncultured Paludibaculum sp.]